MQIRSTRVLAECRRIRDKKRFYSVLSDSRKKTGTRNDLNVVAKQRLSLCGNTRVSYVENTFSEETIKKNDIFRDLVFNQVGNTPLVEIEENIYGKLEGHNPGGCSLLLVSARILYGKLSHQPP